MCRPYPFTSPESVPPGVPGARRIAPQPAVHRTGVVQAAHRNAAPRTQLEAQHHAVVRRRARRLAAPYLHADAQRVAQLQTASHPVVASPTPAIDTALYGFSKPRPRSVRRP